MRKFFLFVLLIMSSRRADSQLQSKGTIIFGGITKEGAMVFADSRCAYTRGDKIVAYYEECQKVHQVNDFVVAMAGLQTYESLSIAGVIDYYTSQNKNVNMRDFYRHFMKFCERFVRPTAWSIFRDNHFIVGGIENGKPIVIYYTPSDEIILSNPGEVVSNVTLPRFLSYDSAFMGCSESNYINYAEGLISVASNERFDSFGTIGGKPSVVSLRKDSVVWISKNKFNFIKNRNIDDNLRNGMLPMKYLKIPEDSIWIRNLFDNLFRKGSM